MPEAQMVAYVTRCALVPIPRAISCWLGWLRAAMGSEGLVGQAASEGEAMMFGNFPLGVFKVAFLMSPQGTTPGLGGMSCDDRS